MPLPPLSPPSPLSSLSPRPARPARCPRSHGLRRVLALAAALLAGTAAAQQNLIILPPDGDTPAPPAAPAAPSLAGALVQRVLDNQLEVRLRSARFTGGDQRGRLTLALPIVNIGTRPVQVQLVGPSSAVDLDSRQFLQLDHERVSGLTVATHYGNVPEAVHWLRCCNNPAQALRRFARLEPGQQLLAVVPLLGPRRVGDRVDIATAFFARVLPDADREADLDWNQRAQAVRTVQVTFSDVPVQGAAPAGD